MFAASGDAYDAFMGRYSTALAAPFAGYLGVEPGRRVLDVGCGPGALTSELVRRLGADGVAACDPSASFVAACADRLPGVDVREAPAEHLPYADATFDILAAQLVVPFIPDAVAAAAEFARVTVRGGTIGVAIWDLERGMEMLRSFWDAALSLDPSAPDELRTLATGREGDVSAWLDRAGLEDVTESMIVVRSAYSGFDELWSGFLGGIGPAGTYCVGLPEDRRAAVRGAMFERIGSPSGSFTLDAVARVGRGVRP
jgi:SAM-dependent methyltransferase